jgi:hypothetical protein
MSWRAFSRIEFSPTIAQVLAALDLEPPPEGRPTTFRAFEPDLVWAQAREERETGVLSIVVYSNGSSRLVADRKAVRQALGLSPGTPSAKALQQWLDWWLPRTEAREETADAADPNGS